MPLVNVLINSTTAGGGGAGGFVRGGAPPPPALSFDYLIVGGGDATYITGYGGGAGGFLASSGSLDFNDTLYIEVGAGGTSVIDNFGGQSSISSSTFGMLIASGAREGDSGAPTSFSAGLGGPAPIGKGGGAGASENGVNGVVGTSGNGGAGLQWLNGTYYAGGGGGAGNATLPSNNGLGGNGGGGRGGPGGCTICFSGSNGVDGTGGGAGGDMEKGGSGVVIFRYATASLVPPYDHALSGGSLSISGGYAYVTFTSSAQLSYRF
jgi:hypothetical protein